MLSFLKIEESNFTDELAHTIKKRKNIIITKLVNKLGSDTDAGWIAYVRGKLLFVKHFPTWRGAAYAGDGHTVEVSWNEQMAALEVFSPLVTVAPGQAFDFAEHWQLIELKSPVANFDDARAAAKKIPASPFAPKR